MDKIFIAGLLGHSHFFKVNDFPHQGQTIESEEYHYELGGKGINQALQCATLNMDVSFVAAVGDDIIIDTLPNKNIDYHLIKKQGLSPTASIIVDKKGDNKVILSKGVSQMIKPDDIDEQLIKNTDIVLLQYEIPKNVIERIINISKKYQKRVVINPAPYIYNDIQLLKKADIITPNRIEICEILGLNINSKIDQIKEEIQKQLKGLKVVVTLGEEGVLLYDDNHFTDIKTIKVKQIDSVGAGDIFNATFCKYLLLEEDMILACNLAAIAASISVTKKYVSNSFVSEDSIKKGVTQKNEKI